MDISIEETDNNKFSEKLGALNDNTLTMRHMSKDDFDIVRNWCVDEEWNIGLYDTQIYYHLDPTGHLIFLKNNEPIGSISLLKHDNNFFTLGPFIVTQACRGKGHGAKIWEKAFYRLKENEEAVILLYAVSKQVSRYAALGFISQFINQRWQLNTKNKLNTPQHFNCERITPPLIKKTSIYDQQFFSSSREIIFTTILNQVSVKGFVIQVDNQIRGFGIIRPCINGYRIGPLIADTLDIAKCLFSTLVNSVTEKSIIVDMPEGNIQGKQLMEYFRLHQITKNNTVAMTKGPVTNEFVRNFNRHYAIFSLEIG